MARKYLLPTFSIFGLVFAFFMVIYGARTPITPEIPFPPPTPPFEHYVAGIGSVEAASRDIAIGVPFSEVVSKVFVEPGDIVQKDDPLFELNTRTLYADLNEAEKNYDAHVVRYENERTELTLYNSLQDKRAVSENEYNQKRYATEIALREVKEAEAVMQEIATQIERSLIKAPISGEVLQVNIRVGESAQVNPFNNLPLIVFGDTHTYQVRVEVDEDDAWRVLPNQPAMAYVRGNRSIQSPLKFLYIEPYMTPKETLSGDNTERVDTRVLQVVFEMERDHLPIYPGQILDVYIQGRPSDEEF